MQVMEGSSYPTTDGSWVKFELRLDDNDFYQIMAEWGHPELSSPDGQLSEFDTDLRYSIMYTRAQFLMTIRARVGGFLSSEDFSLMTRKLDAQAAVQKKNVAKLLSKDSGDVDA